MDKISGQQLKKELELTETKLANLTNKIDRKFELIVNDFRLYLSDDHRDFLIKYVSINTLPTYNKLEIIIQTEANYVEATGNQLNMFN